jgi:hypothetical protein
MMYSHDVVLRFFSQRQFRRDCILAPRQELNTASLTKEQTDIGWCLVCVCGGFAKRFSQKQSERTGCS